MLRGALVLINLLATGFFSVRITPENHPPEVKLVTPARGSVFQWHAPVRYSIAVSDKEDGDSKFQEINPNEVLLEVAFVRDTSAGKKPGNDRAALYSMLGSNCMNCHAFNGKLIGPSFDSISKRYAGRPDLQALIKHVKEGSKGVWGDIVMPSHPELSNEQIGNMVKWILRHGSVPDSRYYLGTEGVFQLSPPRGYRSSSAYSITAGYMDHNHVVGEQTIFVRGNF